MVQRSFGAIQSAGVRLTEKPAQPSIVASAFGTVAKVGVLERGAIGKLIKVAGKKSLKLKTGSYVPDHFLPDGADDHYAHSRGTEQMFLYRVTDGSEKESFLKLYDRKNPRNLVVGLKAKNGGGWGGRKQTWVADVAVADVAETTISLPAALHPIEKNQFEGGKVYLPDANAGSGASFEILSNAKSDGLTKTTLTLKADSKAATALGTPVDTTPEVIIEVPSRDGYNQEKHLAVEVRDGALNPSTEWGLFVYLNGDLVREYPDLSSDPNAANYFVDVINDDGGNEYIKAQDYWVGAITADVRPANHFGAVDASKITATVLDIGTALVLVDGSLAGANTIASFTFGANVIEDTITATYNAGAAAWDIASTEYMKTHQFAQATGGVPYAADTDRTIGFTITENAPQNGEKFTLKVIPLASGEAVRGRVYLPDVTAASKSGYEIKSNTPSTATIVSGDLTQGGTLVGSIKYRLEYKQQFVHGYDGIASLSTNDFVAAFDVANSPFNDLENQGVGLVKFSVEGITSYSGAVDPTQVQKAGIAYCEAKNHMFRVEIPNTITDEFAAKDYVQNTIGKSNYCKVAFPSWGTVSDPVRKGRKKDISLLGAFSGLESRSARDYLGYHKVAAGENTILSRVIALPTGDRVIDGEITNPAGLQRVIKKKGNFVLWGARIPAIDNSFRFVQHREQLSYYMHVLQENFDFIIFAINDSADDPSLIAAFNNFFLPEWRQKRALQGSTFKEAMVLKIDAENNDAVTRANGDKVADLELWLADTVERFIINISKKGVTANIA